MGKPLLAHGSVFREACFVYAAVGTDKIKWITNLSSCSCQRALKKLGHQERKAFILIKD